VVDEVVLARSTMHHSVNYRSVTVFGSLEEITDPDDKREALAAVVDHALPGRSAEARGPDDGELRATGVPARQAVPVRGASPEG
jgi:nitroimidazol reductase NimA-like FMN-containing flavoprotein (pyridoxamine 5'-phosphate oxidase superfamily)